MAVTWDDPPDAGTASRARVAAGPHRDQFDLVVRPVAGRWRWEVFRNDLRWGDGSAWSRAGAQELAVERVRFCCAFLALWTVIDAGRVAP